MYFGSANEGRIRGTTPHNLEAITKLNSIESPLLRLPAELRNRIFVYAIGGHTIQSAEDRELARLGCSKAWFDLGNIEVREPSSIYHKAMLEDEGSRLHRPPLETLISLPLTCRQLCHETVALPFVTNSFIVHLRDLNAFVDTLPEIGRKALKTVYLHPTHYIALDYMHPDDWIPWFVGFARLESLENVVVGYFESDKIAFSKHVLEEMGKRILTNGGKDVEVLARQVWVVKS